MPDGGDDLMVRGETTGLWGGSKPPYKEWKWVDVGMRFGGPNFIGLEDELFIAGTRASEKPRHTGLFII